jgi:uncharacterized membrane protein YhaH (DUF805 family)
MGVPFTEIDAPMSGWWLLSYTIPVIVFWENATPAVAVSMIENNILINNRFIVVFCICD